MKELIILMVIVAIVAGLTSNFFDDGIKRCVPIYASLYVCGDAR